MNLLITVIIGRAEGVRELGLFGIGFAVLGLTQLVSREVGLNAAWASSSPEDELPRSFTRVLVTAAVAAVGLSIGGWIVGSVTLGLTGAAVFFFAIYDFVRLWEISRGRRFASFSSDLLLAAGISLVGGLVLLEMVPSEGMILAWALLLAVLPLWRLSRWQRRIDIAGIRDGNGWSFGPQALVGAGSAHIATMLLGSFVSPVIVGQIRAAASLFGLVNILTSTLQSLAIQSLASAQNRSRTLRRWAVLTSAGQGAVIAAVGAATVFAGPLLFGSSWGNESAKLVWWIALDALAVAVAITAIAAHKVDRAAVSATRVAVFGGIARVSLVPIAGLLWGANAVVASLAFIAIVSATLWWASYRRYMRSRGK